MNIGINGYEAVVPRFGFDKETNLPNRVGSSEFCYQLLVALSKLETKNKFYVYLPVAPTSDMPNESDSWKYEVISPRKVWTLTGLGKKLIKNKDNLDVFFNPTHYLPLGVSIPTVISILDVSYVHFPRLFTQKDMLKLRHWGKYSINKSKKITTISQSSKDDIIKSYKLDPEKIEVIYPGIKNESYKNKSLNMEELNKNFDINGKYILFVGTLQPRKNIAKLIEAFSKIQGEVKLVIIGRRGWQFEEILSAPERFGVRDSVIFLENVGDDDLPSFYKCAEFFILPSLYEGFGLPVLEAMKYDCPVIISNVSSLPEAGGDAALYVDPEDISDMTQKMQKLLDDKDLREELIKKGRDQIKKFSWENSAKQTLKVIEGVANV